jgi:hypothetical protein
VFADNRRVLITLLAALAVVLVSCAIREIVSHSIQDTFRFDGGQVLSDIVITTGGARDDAVTYVPQLTSADYFTLAMKLLPTDDARWPNAFLTSASADGWSCTEPQRIARMDFVWSLPTSFEPPLKIKLRMLIDARYGYIHRQQDHIYNAYYYMTPGRKLDPTQAEAILKAAHSAYPADSPAHDILAAPDCNVQALASDSIAGEWEVIYGSSLLKRTISLTVNADTLVVTVIKRQP